MGSHAKPRATGRKTALGALALGATLTGVGITAAALDPATAVLAAAGPDQGGATQLSGLSSPVADDLGPAADGVTVLSPAPAGTVGSLTNTLAGTGTGTGGAPHAAGSPARPASSGPLQVSTDAPASAAPSASSSGSGGYVGRHARTRSAAPPSDTTPLAGQVGTGAPSGVGAVLPLVQGLVDKVPVVSSLMQGSGLSGTAGGLTDTAAGLADTAGGTAAGSSADPVAGAVGGLPLVGTVLGGSGDGQSALAVPGLSSLGGLL